MNNWYKKAQGWGSQQHTESLSSLKRRITQLTIDSLISFNKKYFKQGNVLISSEVFENFSRTITNMPISHEELRKRNLKSYDPESWKEQQRIQEEHNQSKPFPQKGWAFNALKMATEINVSIAKNSAIITLSVTPLEDLQWTQSGIGAFYISNYYPLVMEKMKNILQHYIGSEEYMTLQNNLRNITQKPNSNIVLK